MEERIRYLFRQYLANTCTRQELEEFLSLVRASGNDEVLRGLIKKVYEDAEGNSSFRGFVNEQGSLVLLEKAGGAAVFRPRRRLRRRMVFAAVILLLAASPLLWLARKPSRPAGVKATASLTKKTTEPSEYKYLLLPDSTQVWLNASSTLEFPARFEGSKREVTLSGEAYFDVRHSQKAPFVIHTGKISTTVLGTSFNIKAYPDQRQVIVAVSTGKVRVGYDERALATLGQGQQVKVDSRLNTVEEKKIEPTAVAAWQQGIMSYDDEALEDIISDLERLYNVRIRIDNAAIRTVKVSTSFRREIGIEQALQVICRLTDTMLRQSDGVYIIQ